MTGSAENGLHVCPECGGLVDRASGYPYWVDRETKQRHHDPCPDIIPPGTGEDE